MAAPKSTTTGPPDIVVVPILEPPSPDIISQIVTFHQRCILHDQVLMRFHPPFTATKTAQMTTYWTDQLKTLPSPSLHVFLALAPPSNPLLVSGAASSGQAVGIVTLSTPTDTDTQSFLGEVGMLLVDPAVRGRGVAKRLMAVLEDKAREMGRTMLKLGTTKGCEADVHLYPKLGWKVWGRLPGYGMRPGDGEGKGGGERVDGVYYYKMLDEAVGGGR